MKRSLNQATYKTSDPLLVQKGTASDGSRRPRIQDVAQLAGVSIGSVSAVLNTNGRLSIATRDRVQAAIAQLGYRPDLYASNLARRQSHVLGLVVSNLQNPFFSETAQAIEEEAAKRDYQISLMATDFSPLRQREAVERLLAARVAGIAVITSEHDLATRKLLVKSGVPSVFLDVSRAAKTSATIRVDSQGGMQAAVEHLIALGHRDILFVRNLQQASGPLLSHTLRDEGFYAAVRNCSQSRVRTKTIDVAGAGAEAGEEAIGAAIGRMRFTAVVALTDLLALGIYRGLQVRGLRIPQDISVVGFDDAYFSRFLNPPLTTVNIPRERLSQIAVEQLLRPCTGSAKGGSIRLATNLVVRESTAPPGVGANKTLKPR